MHFLTCYLISSKHVVTGISFFPPPSGQHCSITNIVTILMNAFNEAGTNSSHLLLFFPLCNAHIPCTVNQLITANLCWQLEYRKVCNSILCYLSEPQELRHWILSRLSQKEEAALILPGWSSILSTVTLKDIFSWAWSFRGCLL